MISNHDHGTSVLAFMRPAALLQSTGNPDFVSLPDLLTTELGDLTETVYVKKRDLLFKPIPGFIYPIDRYRQLPD
jgi:hypothetical protein